MTNYHSFPYWFRLLYPIQEHWQRWRNKRLHRKRFQRLGWDSRCMSCKQWLHAHRDSQCVDLDTWAGDGGDVWVYCCGHCGGINRLIPGLLPVVVHEHEVEHWITKNGGAS